MKYIIYLLFSLLCESTVCQKIVQQDLCMEMGYSGMKLSEPETFRKLLVQMQETFNREFLELKKENLQLKEIMKHQNATIQDLQQSCDRLEMTTSRQNETIHQLMEKDMKLLKDDSLQDSFTEDIQDAMRKQNATIQGLIESLETLEYMTSGQTKSIQRLIEEQDVLRSSLENRYNEVKKNLTQVFSYISRDVKASSEELERQSTMISSIIYNLTNLKSEWVIQTAENVGSLSEMRQKMENAEQDITALQDLCQNTNRNADALNKSMISRDRRIATLTGDVLLANDNIDTLERRMQNLTTDFERLRLRTDSMALLLQQVNASVGVVSREISSLLSTKKSFASLEQSVSSFQTKLQHMNNTLNGSFLQSGFTVRLGNNTDLSSRATIPFSDVLHNIGNVFNESNFNFYAPVDGLYYFHLMACSQKSKRVTAEVVNAQGRIGFVYAEDQNNFDCAGNGVVAILSSGDVVWARAVHASHFDPNTFFSGILIVRSP